MVAEIEKTGIKNCFMQNHIAKIKHIENCGHKGLLQEKDSL